MNATVLVIVGLIIYVVFYKAYGGFLQKSIVGKSDQEVPSKRLFDNVDYVPANKYVLFGHHFASIAGAAPIVGPAIALA